MCMYSDLLGKSREKEGIMNIALRPKQNICLFPVTCPKQLGQGGRLIFYIFFCFVLFGFFLPKEVFCVENPVFTTTKIKNS